VDGLKEQIAQLTSMVDKPTGEKNSHGDHSRKQDVDFLKDQISKLQQAAELPAKNYIRISEILKGLYRAAQAAERPQYAALRPRISTIVEKLAGVFAQVDTVQDLDKPLEAIEKAVHGLDGDQSKNSTYYFDRRGKGHNSGGEDGGASQGK
jgi:polyhydroxyalkanoate synthesis regulator phasin